MSVTRQVFQLELQVLMLRVRESAKGIGAFTFLSIKPGSKENP